MAKLDKEIKEQLKELGVVGVKTEAEARKLLIKKLTEVDVDGVDDETLEELTEMWESFYEDQKNLTGINYC